MSNKAVKLDMTELFSPLETKILEVLGRKTMSIHDITEQAYSEADEPLGANNTIGTAIRRINEKCEYHELDWFLNGEGVGRGGRTIWKEKRTTKG